MRLIDNLYCYLWAGRGNNCHSYLFADVLRGDRPHVLVDPGHVANELNERCLDRLLSAMERDGFKCYLCGSDKDTLHVHHLWYEKDRDPWDYLDVCYLTLCQECHQVEHESAEKMKKMGIRDFKRLGISSYSLWSLIACLSDFRAHRQNRGPTNEEMDLISRVVHDLAVGKISTSKIESFLEQERKKGAKNGKA